MDIGHPSPSDDNDSNNDNDLCLQRHSRPGTTTHDFSITINLGGDMSQSLTDLSIKICPSNNWGAEILAVANRSEHADS